MKITHLTKITNRLALFTVETGSGDSISYEIDVEMLIIAALESGKCRRVSKERYLAAKACDHAGVETEFEGELPGVRTEREPVIPSDLLFGHGTTAAAPRRKRGRPRNPPPSEACSPGTASQPPPVPPPAPGDVVERSAEGQPSTPQPRPVQPARHPSEIERAAVRAAMSSGAGFTFDPDLDRPPRAD